MKCMLSQANKHVPDSVINTIMGEFDCEESGGVSPADPDIFQPNQEASADLLGVSLMHKPF